MNQDTLPPTPNVLLVEDDATLRECLAEVLAGAGWRVREAADATEALGHMALNGVPGVLVTDLALGGGMSGTALIAATRLRWPEARAVLISGTKVAEPAPGLGSRFLRKPFSLDALTRAVSELAGGHAEAGHAAS